MPNLRRAAGKQRNIMLLLLGGAALAACSTPQYAVRSDDGMVTGKGHVPTGRGGVYKVGEPYQVGGIWYVPREQPDYDETGVASYYGSDFHLKATANGETFDMDAPSAAHPTLPLPSMVEVTNLENGRKLAVRVNDRGPFVGGRVIDLSQEAARRLGFERQGTARVRVRYIGRAPLDATEAPRQYARNDQPAQVAPTYSAPVSATPVASAPIPAAAARPLVVTPSTPPASEYASASAPPVKIAATATQAATAAPAPIYSAPVVRPPAPAPTPAPVAATPVKAPSSIYRVQAGAFGDQANAQRAVTQLAGTGAATIEPVDVNGTTLYRVMLQASADEGAAWALREEVAAYGFADARVIRPF